MSYVLKDNFSASGLCLRGRIMAKGNNKLIV